MDNKKHNTYHVKKIIAHLAILIKHTKDMSREAFDKDEILLDAIMFRFIQIFRTHQVINT
jgi:uncharacterized protein with HEPN domain